ncbi:MAG: tetratricopeptide repeat protein, partial [Nannocystaceae bacterium]
ELERLQALPRTLRRIAAAVVVMAGMVVFGARIFGQAEDPCAYVEGEASSLWGDEVAQQVETRFLGSSLPFAMDGWQTIRAELEQYAGRWATAQTAACRRSNGDDVTERELGLRQSLCLAQRKVSFEEVTKMLQKADDALIERATDAVNRLPDLAACTGATGMGAWSPPESETQRLELEGLNTGLARAESALTFYRYEEAATLIAEVIEAIEGTGHVPTLARAYLLSGRIYRRLRKAKEAAKSLQKARRLGDRLGDDFLRARALVELVRVVGYDDAKFDEGLELADDARAAIDRLGGNPLLTADLENHLGSLYRRRGSLADAQQHHQRAMAIFVERLGDAHPETAATLRNLGIVAATQDDFGTAGDAF